ncbi:hypothetical protein Pmani_015789 [Petrolisthes manimaculis]|uniref:Ion transport domain-containing protein n=1 Tax=Petrolisthes manimaculis TaxID=1843537 RepID=A0AAE1PSW8_9EUCA|nr:hypothetical protein Pmani_015789 [Petrolisthes manimaculis]
MAILYSGCCDSLQHRSDNQSFDMKRLWNVLVRKKGRRLSRRVEEDSSEVKREEDGECPECIEMEEVNITTQQASDVLDNASPSLFQAIQNGDLETVRAGANQLDPQGLTPLHRAVTRVWSEGVAVLLHCGASPNTYSTGHDERKETPFHTAIRVGNIQAAEMMLDFHPNLKAVDGGGNTVLHLAAYTHHTAFLNRLLKQEPCLQAIHSLSVKGSSVFHAALDKTHKNVQEEKVLLDTGSVSSLILQQDKRLLAPFHYAVNSSSIDCCKILLMNGDHLTHVDTFVVFTPLYLNFYGTIQQPQEEPATTTTTTTTTITPQNHQRLPLQPYMRTIAALSVFFGWTELMMLFGRLPTLGTNVLMFTSIAKSALKFMTAFSGLLVGFATGFLVLFYDDPFFGTFGKALIKTLMMMIGEVNYTELKVDPNTAFITYLLLVAFLFFVCILMVNLLIGLAVDDISKLQNTGRIAKLSKQASYIVTIEKIQRGAHKYRRRLQCFMIVNIITKRIMACPEKRVYTNKKKSRKTKWEEYNHNISPDTLQRAKDIAKANLNGNDSGSSEEINMKALHGKMERLDHRLSQLLSFLKSNSPGSANP